MEEELRIRCCNFTECEARCCYDGAYLLEDDERRIHAAIAREPAFFSFLPEPPIVVESWRDHSPGRKTATRSFNYLNADFPNHFTRTRCVFAFDDGRCSLQVIAMDCGEHPWSYKPMVCWMYPLHLGPNGLEPPPIRQIDDTLKCNGYPGYTTFTPCGQHCVDGRSWREVFQKELEYFAAVIL